MPGISKAAYQAFGKASAEMAMASPSFLPLYLISNLVFQLKS